MPTTPRVRPRFLAVLGTCVAALTAATAPAAEVHYAYDAGGRLAEARYDDGRVVTYAYDVDGNLVGRTVAGEAPAAFPFVLGDRIDGELSAGDTDLFSFHALADGRIAFDLRGADGLRLRLFSPSGAELDISDAVKSSKKGARLSKFLVTRALLDGRAEGRLALEVSHEDAAAATSYALATREKTPRVAIKVRDARLLDEAFAVHAGALLKADVGSKKTPATPADLTLVRPDLSAETPDGPLVKEQAKKGRTRFSKVPLEDDGTYRLQSAVATTALIRVKYSHRARKLTAPDG